MKILFGVLVIIFALGLFLVNYSLGVLNSIDVPSFSFSENAQINTVLEGLAEQIEEGKQDLAVQELKKTIAIPEPLKIFQKESQGPLTTARVLVATNDQRQQNGLFALLRSVTLDKIAEAKVKDMFDLQYFEHTSPTGILFTHLADQFGYEYITMGENLALGLYESEEVLVQAWMDSPGHRANILNSKYSEIGLAVDKGFFDGQEVWLAVQTFGRPLSACLFPDENLKADIEFKKLEIKELQMLLNKTKEDLDALQQKQGSTYQEKLNEYNSLVGQYNKVASETQDYIDRYNAQVNMFNSCADFKNDI